MSSTMQERMGAFDAVMWNVEEDPVLRSVIVAMMVLDKAPDIDAARDRIERMTLAVPKLRQRVVGNPVSLVPPRWEFDPNFDLTYHLRWVAAPRKDRTLRPALNHAQTMAEQDFDRKRPLWEMTLMTGLPRGQAALIIKIHHAITDGMGGLAMGAAMLDLARDTDVDLGDKPSAPSAEALGLSGRLSSGVSYEAKRFATTSMAAVTGLGDLALRTVKDPRGAAGDAAAFVSSAGRLLAPAGVPESPLMTARSLSGYFDYFEAPFGDVKKAAKANGGTINDAFMTVVTRGLHRYHMRHGGAVPGLRVNMPINLRTGTEDANGGNRWVPARVILPVDEPDASQHMKVLHPLLRQAATEPALMLSDQVYRLLVRMPTSASTALSAGLMKGTDFAATNLPGPPIPVYFSGAEVTALLPFAPRGGAALNVAMITYNGKAEFAINIDERAVENPTELVDDLKAALAEVVATGSA
ncbi:MAG: wax ester/triacylglycerol synthase domain-containing protein [Jiangellales bacterium]